MSRDGELWVRPDEGHETAQSASTGTTRREALLWCAAATATGVGLTACNDTPQVAARTREDAGATREVTARADADAARAEEDATRADEHATRAKEDATRAREDALDHALGVIHAREPMGRGGLSSHAPMVAETLCVFDRPDRAVARVEKDRAQAVELPRPSARIDREDWRAVLGIDKQRSNWEGANGRWGDWRVFFTEQLENARWQDVLDTWAARLAPGLCGAATHGVIRTGHAVRALSRRDSPQRRAELARGLAYWASSYEELPGRAAREPGKATYAEALARVPLYWDEFGHSPGGGSIVAGLRRVGDLERFAEVRDMAASPTDVSAALSELSATFARVYLRQGTRYSTIAFVHAVTGPCALRRIAPHVKPETARAALPYAWQAAAAIYAAYARKEAAALQLEPELTASEITARAVENGDDHAVKFSEVLLAEHALAPDPAYLVAAQDIVKRL